MNIQTISIVSPTEGCVNSCKFCVSKTHSNDYENCFNKFSNESYNQMKKRIKHAKNLGVNTCIVTGSGEVLQNQQFIEILSKIFQELDYPFTCVELQTSGVFLNDINRLKEVKSLLSLDTVSISVSDLFDDISNMEIIGTHEKLRFTVAEVCKNIKALNLNLRLSLNLTNKSNDILPVDYFIKAKELSADQLTFRKLYHSNNDTEVDRWIIENALSDKKIKDIEAFIVNNGERKYRLPFGSYVYRYDGISTIVDVNSMGTERNKETEDNLKYLVLRENGKLYTDWLGTLLF